MKETNQMLIEGFDEDCALHQAFVHMWEEVGEQIKGDVFAKYEDAEFFHNGDGLIIFMLDGVGKKSRKELNHFLNTVTKLAEQSHYGHYESAYIIDMLNMQVVPNCYGCYETDEYQVYH